MQTDDCGSGSQLCAVTNGVNKKIPYRSADLRLSTVALTLSSPPAQLERSYQRFTAFYASRHSGRKLTWLYHLSKGELVTNCFKNRYACSL